MANTQRITHHSVLIPNWDMYIILLILRIRDQYGRQGRKIIRVRGRSNLKEIVFARYIGTVVHINSQQLWSWSTPLQAQDLHWAWLWEGSHEIPPLHKVLLAFDSWLGEEELTFFKDMIPGRCSPNSRTSLYPRVSGQYKLD